jgi:hypothetical protein
MNMFEIFDLHIAWAGERSRKFKKYMENHDSVELLTYCAKFINDWFKSSGACFKTKKNLPAIGPSNFNITIMSPDGETDWTRMTWMIREFIHDYQKFTTDYLSKVEKILVTNSGYPYHAQRRQEKWQREKYADTHAKKNKDVSPTEDFLRHVRRRLEKEEVNDTVSLELWTKKLDVFCSHLENVVKMQPTTYYDKIMDLFYELQGQVHSSPDTERISAIIQEITDKVDEEAQNTTFMYHSIFEFEKKDENIMEVLDRLPEELQELTAPSRSRSPSRSPEPSFSPAAPPSPQARYTRSGGGVGGSRRAVNMEGLLRALQALV